MTIPIFIRVREQRTRQEFPTAVRVFVIKRATINRVVYCEACGCPAKKFHIDHIIADALGGKPTAENAKLLCSGTRVSCHGRKTAEYDMPLIARVKQIEAHHLGATRPKGSIPSRKFRRSAEAMREPREALPYRQLFEVAHG